MLIRLKLKKYQLLIDALNNNNPLDVLAYQYDLVCNGVELSSGAIRNHKPEIMYKAFDIAGYTKEEVEEYKNVIKKQTENYDFPVLFNVDIGHSDPIITLPLNVEVSLDSSRNTFIINESGVV